MKNYTLYILVRKDMTYSCPAAQAGHAIAEYLLKRNDVHWMNDTLILLGLETKTELDRWCRKLNFRGIKWYGFIEPDYNDELTAIAVPLDEKQSSIFNKLKLL